MSEWLRNLVANIPAIIYRCAADADWSVEFISEGIVEISGYPASDFIHNRVRTLKSIIYPADREMVEKIVYESTKASRPYSLEYRINHCEAGVRWVCSKGRGVFSNQGELLFLCGAIFDITDRKRVEVQTQCIAPSQENQGFTQIADTTPNILELLDTIEQLRASEERFRTIANSAPLMIWTTNCDGQCDFINQFWLEFTGRTRSEVLTNGWMESVHPQDRQRCWDTCLSAFAAQKPCQQEYRLRQSTGEYRWILDTGVPQFRPDGSFGGYIGSCLDITQSKQAQEALRSSTERERLVAVISQRIRQSLKLENILNTAVSEVRQLLACDRVMVYRIWPEGTGSIVSEAVVQGLPTIAGQAFSEDIFSESCCESLGIGITVPVPHSSPDTLIRTADQALYEAKNQGRDRAILKTCRE